MLFQELATLWSQLYTEGKDVFMCENKDDDYVRCAAPYWKTTMVVPW